MNWKKITLATTAPLAAITLSVSAQAAPRGGGGGSHSAILSHGLSWFHSGRSFGHGRGNYYGRGRYGGGYYHHRYYPRYYYGGLYPFGFGYPFGYGYGYGYGYPYYGTSASFYYGGGYNTGYRRGGGNIAANVQQQLSREGYYRGSIDGVIGNQTRRAIRAYERANRLPVDGEIDQQLLETMGLS